MLLRCPHCGMDHPVRYRTGRGPPLYRCASCRQTFAYFPALELEYAGTARRHFQKGYIPPSPQPRLRLRLGLGLRAYSSDRLDPAQAPEDTGSPAGRALTPGQILFERLAALTTGVVLILALLAQALVQERAHLAMHPELRFLSEELCSRLRCPEPVLHIPGAVAVRAVSFNPDDKPTILVDLRLENTIDQAHPWPLLEIAFSDRYGRVLGQGRWHPLEYLPPPGSDRPVPLLAPGQIANLRLEIGAPARLPEGVAVWPL